MAKKKQTFEASLEELERIVTHLEDGDLSLEESLKLFEEGVRLSRDCQARLDQAERRIEVLLKDENGDPVLKERKDIDTDKEKPKVKKRIVFGGDDEDDDTPF